MKEIKRHGDRTHTQFEHHQTQADAKYYALHSYIQCGE